MERRRGGSGRVCPDKLPPAVTVHDTVTGLSPRLETGKRGRVVVIACTGREVGGLVLGATGSAKTSTKHSPTSLLDVKAEDNEKRKFRRL